MNSRTNSENQATDLPRSSARRELGAASVPRRPSPSGACIDGERATSGQGIREPRWPPTAG